MQMNLAMLSEVFLKEWILNPTEGQRRAIDVFSQFLWEGRSKTAMILQGYAGTGKTTLLRTFSKWLPSVGFRVVFMAPTGRAAKVMLDSTGRRAYTVHRILYRSSLTPEGHFSFGLRTNPLTRAVFFVDESSMVSDRPSDGSQGRSLLEDILFFVHSGVDCRLVFLGDPAQLPPVGEGKSPALDADRLLKQHGWESVSVQLTEVVRQEKTSWVLRNATRLREALLAESIQFPGLSPKGEVHFLQDGYEVMEALEQSYSAGVDQTIVVTRSNKRAVLYNRQIRSRLLGAEELLGAGDRVMVVKNNYHWLPSDHPAGFLANGDIFEVMALSNQEDKYGLVFADARLRWTDREDDLLIEAKVLLTVLDSDSPAMRVEESQALYQSLQAEYAHFPTQKERKEALRVDPYAQALQLKFAYAVTCHKAQGGQWETVFIEQAYEPEGLDNAAYLRWLYTALTRTTNKVYLVGFRPEDLLSE